jgi:membrane protein
MASITAGKRGEEGEERNLLDNLPDWRAGDVDVKRVIKETVGQIGDNDIPGLSSEMAYHSALALFPFLLFLAGLTAVLDSVFGIEDLTGRIVEELSHVLSDDATAVLESLVEELRNSDGLGAMVFGLAGALWAGSSVMGSAMKGLNRIEDRKETRGMVRRKLLAIGLSVVFSGLLMTAAVLVGGSEIIGEAIGDRLHMGDELQDVLGLLAWPLSVLLVVAAVALLYWLGPAGESEFRWVTPGAALFAVGWLVASFLFALYIANFGSYNSTYGALGLVIILLVWLYWSNLLLLVGAQVNFIVRQIVDGPTADIEPQPKNTQAQP